MTAPQKTTLFIKYAVVWAIALSIGLYVRLYPLRTHTSQDASEKATIYVLSKLHANVLSQIESTHKDLSKEQKDVLAKSLFDELLKKESLKVRASIAEISQTINEEQNSKIQNIYLLASDSFYYYNLTQNIIQTGKISDTIKGSKYLNKLMLAPDGHWEPLNLHPYVGFWIYRALQLFDPDIPIMRAVSFTPLVLVALALIPFIWITYRLGCSPLISLVSSTFFLMAPIFVRRSMFGWYDNDPHNILFPLLILGTLIGGLCTKNSTKQTILYAVLTAVLIGTYSLFWHGWMLLFCVLLFSGLVAFLYACFYNKSEAGQKISLCYFGWFAAISFLAISLIFGMDEFFKLFSEGWIALKNFMSPQLSLWPDLYISVGELKKANLSSLIELTGGKIVFILAMLGAATSILSLLARSVKENTSFIIVLFTFLTASLVIASGAQRFAMLSLVPLGLFFCIGLNFLMHLLNRVIPKTGYAQPFSNLISLMILALIFIPIQSVERSIKTLLNPLYNDVWNETLVKIREGTPKESIINTWWPPGHFIKSIAQRRVTFDGATINKPQAYWMANVFLSQNEDEALNILRMLNNSGNAATEFLLNRGYSLSSAIALLREILKNDDFKARMILSATLKDEAAVNQILEWTHGKTSPAYLLLYKEFVEANLQLKFVGRWNFKEIERINADPEVLASVPDRNSKAYINFLWKLAGGAPKYSGPLAQVSRANNQILFAENIRVDLTTHTCVIDSDTYGRGIPYSIFFIHDDEVVEQKLAEATLPYSVVLYKRNGAYMTVLMDRSLAQSLLVRLYYFRGKGLKHFTPFLSETDLTHRNEILVYQVKN